VETTWVAASFSGSTTSFVIVSPPGKSPHYPISTGATQAGRTSAIGLA
jgi:hypothetical protein